MKKLSKILALVLVAAMLMSFSSAFAMGKHQHKQYAVYTCIGDSIAAGYSVDGTGEATGFVRVPGAYHDLLATMVDAQLIQLGCSAFRTVELRYMLDGVYNQKEGDTVWADTWGKYTFAVETLDAYLTQNFRDAISASDLVTINLGSNDIMSYTYICALRELYAESASIPGMDKLKENLEKTGDLGAALSKGLELAEKAGKLPNVLKAIVEALNYTVNQFKENWTASIDAILGEGGLNPDTVICGVGAYNPGNHIYLDSNNTIDLALLLRPVVSQINAHMKSFESKYPGHYVYADMIGVETFDVAIGDPEFVSYFTWASHPTRQGHMEMATRIYDALPDHWVSPVFTAQPQDVTVAAGESASFQVAVKGNYPTYQWQQLQKAEDGSVNWTNIPGATSKTLSVTAADELDGQQYRCVVSQAMNNAEEQEQIISDVAVLHVTDASAPADDPSTDPADDPSTDPADDPSTDPADDPSTDPADDPSTDPADDPSTDPADDPSTDPADDPSTDPADDPTTEPDKFPFVDVPESKWSYNDIHYVWENGLMNGKDETIFDPEGTTTRAEFATVIYRMADRPPVTDEMRAKCKFVDLKEDWYNDAVIWAFNAGVVNGTSSTTFSPNDKITREQMVAMLYRFAKADDQGDLSKIKDAASIEDYAKPAVAWAVKNGVVTGFEDGTFQPKGNATREQMAAIIARFDRLGK